MSEVRQVGGKISTWFGYRELKKKKKLKNTKFAHGGCCGLATRK